MSSLAVRTRWALRFDRTGLLSITATFHWIEGHFIIKECAGDREGCVMGIRIEPRPDPQKNILGVWAAIDRSAQKR